ncbi:MAG: hypothetical protein WCP65_00990 [Bacteroidota bacterium]
MAKFTDNISIKRLQNRYRLVVMNDDTFEEVITFKLSRISVYISMSVIFILLVGLTVGLIVFTPLKYYIPGYGNMDSKTELQLLKIRTDSLEQSLHYKEQYIVDVKKVLEGNTPGKRDTVAIPVK